jgi:hypothetical protein
MTWFLLIEQAIFLFWIIGGSVDGANTAAKDCATEAGRGVLSQQTCLDASHAGTAIGVGLIIVLWFMATVVTLLVWMVTRRRKVEVVVVNESRAGDVQPS